jgi:carboxymethylenebutenolidase
LTSADGTRFSAALAEAAGDATSAVVILPDLRGLHPFYSELVERFAQAGHHAIAIDYFGRTAGLLPRDASFDFVAHVQQTKVAQVQADTLAAAAALRERAGASKIATVGFCFGGLHSFLAGADLRREITGVVGFHRRSARRALWDLRTDRPRR